ncbi:MAG TPA: DUF4123 domain-containing protein [Acetobacteraceae bacterium]|jgi:hypothetical protein
MADIAALRRDPAAKAEAIRCLWQLSAAGGRRQSYLYAVLDAARDKRIYPRLRQLAGSELVVGLYQGRTATELAAVAPYLVCLGTIDRVFDWLWDQGWGESWGIFLWSLVSPETLRAHFRRLNMVQTEQKQRLLFRFYDPRVLRSFLSTCDATQLREMFGPVAAYMVESEEGDAIITYRGPDRLTTATTVIAPPVIASEAKQSPAGGGTNPLGIASLRSQ